MGRGGARIGAGRKRVRPLDPETEGVQGSPAGPPWLSPAARELYVYYAQQLGDRMTAGDRDALASYATTLAELAAIERDMQQPGFTRVVAGRDGLRLHPLVAERRQVLASAKMWATALGLTPTSRRLAKRAGPVEVKRDWRAVVYQTPTR